MFLRPATDYKSVLQNEQQKHAYHNFSVYSLGLSLDYFGYLVFLVSFEVLLFIWCCFVPAIDLLF